jgi:hypothetical protein
VLSTHAEFLSLFFVFRKRRMADEASFNESHSLGIKYT